MSEFFVLLDTSLSFNQLDINSILQIVFFILLIISSAMISGSEVAYFSLTPNILKSLEESNSKTEKKILKLIGKPNRLLATILIANNFVNIAIVVLATYITQSLINFGDNNWLKFVFEAIIVTFIILLFGEIIPKIYANKFKKSFATAMALPLSSLEKILYPFASLLVKSTNIVNKKLQTSNELSISDLSYAIDITSESTQKEKKILKNVVNLSNVEVREIITPRVDVTILSVATAFGEVKKIISESGYSRIPVYEDDLDKIIGILYIKDIVNDIEEDDSFDWQKYIKPAFFVPENKKIDDLLQEFKTKKIHLAIVSDEYAGFSGIVTLEDILEEIIGEIKDEFDVSDDLYQKISDNKYNIDGKLLLKDFQRIIAVDDNYFDDVKGDAETVAGLLLEMLGEFPTTNKFLKYRKINFTVLSVKHRRIERINVKINK